jgi:WD40 repeat protein
LCPLRTSLLLPGSPLKYRLTAHQAGVRSIAINSNNIALSASSDSTVKIWNINSGFEIGELQGHKAEVHAIAFFDDGEFAASGAKDGLIKVWDINNRQVVADLHGHTGLVSGIATINNMIISTSFDGTLRLWDWGKSSESTILCNVHESIMALKVTSNKKYVVMSTGNAVTYEYPLQAYSENYKPHILLYDLDMQKFLFKIQAHAGAIFAIALTNR